MVGTQDAVREEQQRPGLSHAAYHSQRVATAIERLTAEIIAARGRSRQLARSFSDDMLLTLTVLCEELVFYTLKGQPSTETDGQGRGDGQGER